MPSRILLVRTDRIGDTLLTLPAVTTLRSRFPDSFIGFLCQPYTEAMTRRWEGLDLVLTYDASGRHRGWSGLELLAEELIAHQFDAVVLFFPRPALVWALWRADIARRYGTGYRWYSFLLTDRILEHRSECRLHEVEYNLNLLSPLLGGPAPKPVFHFRVDPELENSWELIREQMQLGSDYAIVHPGNGDSAPNLSINQYRHLILELLNGTGWQVLLTGTMKEKEAHLQLMQGLPGERVRSLAGSLNLVHLMEAIREARLIVTSSTGPLHLADAQNTPLLGFYCPVPPHTPVRWGPYQQRQWVVTPELESPKRCRFKSCPFDGCLHKLDSNKIKEAMGKRIADLMPVSSG